MLPAVKAMWIVVTCAVALATSGCGSVDDRGSAASDVAARLRAAVDSKDGATACNLLAPDTASEVAESAGKSCADAILEEDLPTAGTVIDAAVYGQWAQVRLSDDTMFLGAFPGGWRVVAAGCTPQADQPYDCTVQGG
jgi:uncharacterized protein YceK